MINFLRKLRKNESGKGLGSYFFYALGEIVLVVVGILIALSINNWNEERKHQQQLRNIFLTLKDDIHNDLGNANEVLEYYEGFKDEFIALMEGSMSLEYFQECQQCPYLVTGHRSFIIEVRAYEALKEYNTGYEEDSLVNEVVQFFTTYIEDIYTNDQLIRESIAADLVKWRDQYDWFPDFARQVSKNEPYARYSVSSKEIRNITAWRYALIYTNYVPKLQEFRDGLEGILASVEERLDE